MNRRALPKKHSVEEPVDTIVAPASVNGAMAIEDSTRCAGAKLCRELLGILRNDAPGAIKGEDAEHVHRMRIAVRKLRIVLQLWNGQIDKKISERLKEEIRWLTGLLGRARDADILEIRFEAQWAGELFTGQFKQYIRQKLEQKGSAAKAELASALASGRFERLLVSFEHLFDPKTRGDVDPPLRDMVPHYFSFAVKKVGRYAGRNLDYSELHSLRITFKRLRYISEFFGDFYPGKLAGYMGKFRKYQELLGFYCDARVAEAFLSSLTPEGAPETPAARRRCFEIGGLIHIQRMDAAEQYRRFEKKGKQLPGLLKSVRQQTKRI